MNRQVSLIRPSRDVYDNAIQYLMEHHREVYEEARREHASERSTCLDLCCGGFGDMDAVAAAYHKAKGIWEQKLNDLVEYHLDDAMDGEGPLAGFVREWNEGLRGE